MLTVSCSLSDQGCVLHYMCCQVYTTKTIGDGKPVVLVKYL